MAKQQSLFDYNYSRPWPPQDKFPVNERTTGAQVNDVLMRDILRTKNLLIVTGFTSLAHLIQVFGKQDIAGLETIRIVFGFDMDQRVGRQALHFSLSTEAKNYWAKQSVSLSLCGAVINLIDKVEKGQVSVRIIRHLHAKLYVADSTAMLGSSNFSKTGLASHQREANIRVHRDIPEEEKQHEHIKQLAENFYDLGDDYNADFLDMLRNLFKDAIWQEALARAIAEILENKWMLEYPALYRSVMGSDLWPTQRTAISKAMKIIQDQGNCLLADPTGSGKTRLGTALLYTIFHWLWENGMRDRSNALIISPKQVVDFWKDARTEFKLINEVVSMGQLSNGTETTWKRINKQLQKTDILLVDEAHNYLNWGTKRSSRMQPKRSAHVVLATATPINKKAEDLLRLVELLDIDNLNEKDLAFFQQVYPLRKKEPDEATLNSLRQYINQFIVRRTKKQLNQIIEQTPDLYRNNNGKPCRYPTNSPKIYPVNATGEDLKLAETINTLIKQLKGVNYLQEWKMPAYYATADEKAAYVNRRFVSAPALAGFRVKSSLRSSKVALYEMIFGTEAAQKEFALATSKKHSGNIIRTLQQLAAHPPELAFPAEWVPATAKWILDEETYREACDKEVETYRRIAQALLHLSNTREEAKADLLVTEARNGNKVLAFDATLVTLDYLYKIVTEKIGVDCEVLLATGQDESGKKRVIEAFSHDCTYDGKPVIALCSDAMSESINLPAAKTLVLLDVPSVPRIVEQRIGRLERMDSEHDEIIIYWPEDEGAFSLKSDQRLVKTLATTGMLIGNNVDLPLEGSLSFYFSKALNASGIIEGFHQYIEQDGEWQGVQDTTTLLQSLIYGKKALISTAMYELYRDVDASVKTAISFIQSDRRWSFFALRGDVQRSAKWLFIENGEGTTDFTLIAEKLKAYLSADNVVQRKWSEIDLNNEFPTLLHFLRKHEALLLPNKKRRALKVGEKLLSRILANDSGLTEARKRKIETLLKWHGGNAEEAVDSHHFADLWLQILQPALDEKRNRQLRKRKPLSLNDLTTEDVLLTEDRLDFLLDEGQSAHRIDEVVAACIISLPH